MAPSGPDKPQQGSQDLIVWRLSDDKPGHDKQSLGLAQALARLRPVQVHDIHLPQDGAGLVAWLRGRFRPGQYLPAPQLILGAGHATHIPMLAARRAYGGRAVVLMRPSLPLGLFDLCLIPFHDQPPRHDNVITTRGALNTVMPGDEHDPARGLFLVGGPSRHYRWDDQQVAVQVREIVTAAPQIQWTLTTSRRTPAAFLAELTGLPGLTVLPHDQTAGGWLERELAQSGPVWVTPDSVSMVHEAITAGCHVGLLALARAPLSRVARGVEDLLAEGYVTTLDDWRGKHALAPARQPLQEADRCARLLQERWL